MSDHVPSYIAKSLLKNICVYCGSSSGQSQAYEESAKILARAMTEAGLHLVYGGGNLGLMGAVAQTVLEEGGYVTGIIPDFLCKPEMMLENVQNLIITADMHERKRLMYEHSDAFIALPGGIGTLEELVEQMTWAQLGRHNKPIILANFNQFWNPFMELLQHMRQEAFIRPGLDVIIHVVENPEDIVPKLFEISQKQKTAFREDKDILGKM